MQHKLPQITTIGRSKTCDIQVSPKLTKVSRQHAEIKIHNGDMYVLYDRSATGTFVNGQKQQQIILKNGDRINLAGVVELQFFNGTLTSSSNQLRVTSASAGAYGASPVPAPIPAYDAPQELPVSYNYPQDQGYSPPVGEYASASVERVSTGYKVSASGALAAIMFFFFPWIVTSCGGVRVEQTGWDLAAGSTINYGFGSEAIPGDPVLFIVLIAAFLVFPLLFFAYQRGMLQPLLDGIGLIATGAIPLFVLLLFYLASQSEASDAGLYGIQVEYQFGLFAVILGYIAVIAGGVMNLRSSPRSSPAQYH